MEEKLNKSLYNNTAAVLKFKFHPIFLLFGQAELIENFKMPLFSAIN